MNHSRRFHCKPYYKLPKDPKPRPQPPGTCLTFAPHITGPPACPAAESSRLSSWAAAGPHRTSTRFSSPSASPHHPSPTCRSTVPRTPPARADDDYEVALDIEVSGAAYYAATGQAATIRVYWSQDIGTAVQKAACDGCDVCTISWGADEANFGATAAEQMESTAESAVATGMIVFAASGDNDSSDGGPSPANVDCPSSCPHVVGCGGTIKNLHG